MQAAASYRTVSFAKYLPRFGYQVTVLTVRINKFTWNGAINEPTVGNDNIFHTSGFHTGEVLKALFRGRFSGYGKTRTEFKAKHSVRLKRFLVYFYDNVLTFPDPAWCWYLLGMKKATRVAMKIKPDIVLSSAMPISGHLLARHIKSRFHMPWIADYRDLWSQSHINNRKPFFNSLELSLEKKLLKETDALTTVSEPLAVKLRQEYDKPVHVITNGFDPDDFDAASNSLPSGWNDTVKNAVYTGMIHPDRQNPGPLFEAIQLLIENHRIRKGDFAFRLFGPNIGFVKSLFPSRLLEDFVIVGSNLHRNQALNCQKNADLLIVFDWMDPEEKGVYTTKFFEYIGAGKPILSIGHKGSVIDITLKTEKLGITENDPVMLAKILERFIKNGTMEEFSPRNAKSRKLLKQFTREYQAEKLAGILGRVIDRN